MKYIWLIFMLLMVLRSVGSLMKRSESRGKLDAPRADLPFDEEDFFLESSPAGEPGESEPGLNMPECPAGRGRGLTKLSDVSRSEGRPEKPARESRPDQGNSIDSRQELHGRCGGAELFDGGIGQREFIKGMVWSQILGPRGGIQASKRFKPRY